VRGLLKPISTLRRPLESVDLTTREPALAAYERSDVAVVPAAGVIGEAMVALVLAQAFLEKFGGDSLDENPPQLSRLPRSGAKLLEMATLSTTNGKLVGHALACPNTQLLVILS